MQLVILCELLEEEYVQIRMSSYSLKNYNVHTVMCSNTYIHRVQYMLVPLIVL